METLAKFLRYLAKLRFRLLGLATIKDIPTEDFNALIKEFIDDGWKARNAYNGYDSWIDYGKVKLSKKGIRLTCEWDNWTEGSFEGPKEFIHELARKKGFESVEEWRWQEYDDNTT